MKKALALTGALLCTAICVAPSYARRGVHGTLAIRLYADRGGPPGRRPGAVRLPVRLVVRTAEGVTVLRSERYVTSGHVFTLRLPAGIYTVNAAELPPVVNPTERQCLSASRSVHVRLNRTVHTSVTCVLVG